MSNSHPQDEIHQGFQSASFPWELGICDAHCHPTDTMSSIPEIANMKAQTLTVMATRGEDQELVHGVAASLSQPQSQSQEGMEKEQQKRVQRVIPCFGWHPWFSYQLFNDIDDDTTTTTTSTTSTTSTPTPPPITNEQKLSHYQKVLTPTPTPTTNTSHKTLLTNLPTPHRLTSFISKTKARLLDFPHALVGEVGLDRSFRIPNPWTESEAERRDAQITPGSREGRSLSAFRVDMVHQRVVLKAQLRVAGELRRAVSVHSVQAHGVVLEVLRELWRGFERKVPSKRERRRMEEEKEKEKERGVGSNEDKEDGKHGDGGGGAATTTTPLPFPPRLCMHSYSGPVDQLRLFLDPSVPVDVYFSFSSAINLSGPASPAKVLQVIKALPDDRVLVESDLHTAGTQMDELLEDIVRTVCHVRGWELEGGVRQLRRNWERFVFG